MLSRGTSYDILQSSRQHSNLDIHVPLWPSYVIKVTVISICSKFGCSLVNVGGGDGQSWDYSKKIFIYLFIYLFI